MRSAATTFATNLGVAVVSLVNVIITARYLGPAGRGDIALLFTVSGLTATLGNFGVQQAIVNIGGREPRHRPALATNAVLLTLILGAIFALAYWRSGNILTTIGAHFLQNALAVSLLWTQDCN